jgi:hypothetical protein
VLPSLANPRMPSCSFSNAIWSSNSDQRKACSSSTNETFSCLSCAAELASSFLGTAALGVSGSDSDSGRAWGGERRGGEGTSGSL